MKKQITLIRMLIVAVLIAGFSLYGHGQEYKDGVLQGTFRIKLKPALGEAVSLTKTADNTINTGIKSIDVLNAEYSVKDMKRVFPYSPKFEEKLQKHGLHLWYEVTVGTKAETKAVISSYESLSEISIAEAIYEKILIEPGTPRKVEIPDVETGKSEPFNDPYLPKQWHYNNTGQTGGTPGADINLYDAWAIETGSSNVIVSIHDQGVDYDHEDLAGNMWVNEAELNGDPMVDDDGNGYKDDVYGFNFADNMGEISPDYHGTHVAGTIGAMNNNGIGVAGVAGGTDTEAGVRMMSCQILGGVSQGNLPSSFTYAANMGAVISQNSWGYSSAGVVEQAVLDGIDYFIEEAGDYAGSPMQGGVVIFASGNNYGEGEYWPGCYENVIAVSAVGASNIKASYSNYGTWVDISAPGGDFDDNVNMSGEQVAGGFSNGVMSTFENNSYGYLDGTSMACPHVSGIAALVVSKYGGNSFTAEDLKTHLLTGVNDIYNLPDNSSYIGKLGFGASDALLALGTDNGLAPNAIADLAVSSIAQDFVNIEWSVPTDSDDGQPYSFEVLYSKESISLGTLEFAQSSTIKNENATGETVTFEVEGLDALTQYYFAVRGIDRWGNVSDFSNEVTATTNEGPDAWIDMSGFDYETTYIGYDPITYASIYDTTWYVANDIDVQVNPVGDTSFYLHNSGAGVLRWDVIPRHVESIDASSVGVRYPEIREPGAGFKPEIRSVVSPINQVQTFAQEENWEVLDYINNWGSKYYIGETDTSFSNSAATHFVVENSEGFNLTHAELFINYESTDEEPLIFEIYFGEDINTAQLTYVQELTDTDEGWYYFNLEEQIFMEEGTHFWLVYHIPSGNLYPLGAVVEIETDDSENCYMSLNMGKSWQLFEDLYYNNLLVWGMAAVSEYKTMGDYITLSPLDGEVLTDDSTLITATLDATTFINGTYKTSVVVNTNDVDDPMLRANIWTEVTGQESVITGESIVDFGSVLYGNQKLIDITISNEGLGKFKWPSTDISDTQFELVGSLSDFNPLSEITFQMIYTPDTIGNANAKVTITDGNNGDEYVFNVFGVGAEPPAMELAPDSTAFLGITIGDTITGDFYVKNTGQYPLNYYFPAFADGENVEVVGETCKFGYSAKTNPGGIYAEPAHDWYDISATGTDLTGYSTDRDFFFYNVDLGFDFPFFGKMENSVYITNLGMLTFDQNSVFNIGPLHYKDKWDYLPDRYISAMGVRYNLAAGGNIYYQDLGDRFIVQYDKVLHTDYWMMTDHELTFQIVLHANGDINIYYNDMGGMDPNYLLNEELVAIEDKNQDDGLCVGQYSWSPTFVEGQDLQITDLTVVEFINPGLGLIYEMDNAEGLVQPGDSIQVTYSASTNILTEADYIERIPLLSNDPFNNPGLYTMYLNVTDGGGANITLNTNAYDFGQVFLTDNVAFDLWVVNDSTANDTIVSAAFDNDYFTISGDIPAVAAPNRKLLYSIEAVSTTLGTFEDTLRLTTALGDEFKITLNSEVVEAPQIATNIASITDTVAFGETKTISLTVNNAGNNDLEFAPIGTDWLTVSTPPVKANTVPEYTYTWNKSTDEDGPTYIWTDISETGTRLDSIDSWGSFSPGYTYWSKGIELPFKFNFYGNEYDTLYVGPNGVMTFTEDDPANIYPFGGQNMPNAAAPNNLIAPLFAFAYPDSWIYEDWGVYYQEYTDHFVVQWHRYTDGFFMGYGISWQAIIYKDGNIKFQYNWGGVDQIFLDGNGVIGLENEDGTDAVLISNRTGGFVQDQMAIAMNPIRKYTVPAGGSSDFDITINAKEIYAGDYTHDLVLYNNTPDTGDYTIPVELHVTGEANLVYSDSIGFGDVMVSGTPIVKEFEVVNDGAASLEILSFDALKLANTTVEAYAMGADFMGNEILGWNNVMFLPAMGGPWWAPYPLPVIIEPNSSLKFRATIDPSNGDPIRDTLSFTTDHATTPDYQITFAADPFLPPVADVSEEKIDVYAETATHTETRTFDLDNQGASDLTYELEIVYTRNIEETANTSKGTANAVAPELVSNDISGRTKKAKSIKYNRILEHETATTPETSLGYGGTAMFLTGTKFTAPSNGFNLTHVQSYYVPAGWLDSKIIVEILSGASDINNASVIHTQEYQYTIDAPDAVGSFITIELDQNQIFFPNEDFFVVFKYPTGVDYPQGSVTASEVTEGRYLYGNGEAWFDITDAAGFEDLAWMVKAVENEFASSVWVELTSALSGTVVAGNTVSIDLDFMAAYAENGTNEADVMITTNDPSKTSISLPVSLYKNEGPYFDLGTEVTLSVNENESLTLAVEAEDLEDDNYTLSMADSYEFVTATFSGGVLNFTYTPDYEAEGMHTFMVNGADEFGNTSEFAIHVGVINVNRAPVALVADTITLTEGGASYVMLVTDLFTDPDGDAMTMDAITTNAKVDVVGEGDEYVIVPQDGGTSGVIFTAADEYGDTASNFVTVFVDTLNQNPVIATEIEDVDMLLSDAAIAIDLNSHFSDPDGDQLAYSLVEYDATIADIAINDASLTIAPLAEGITIVSLYAEDSEGLNVTESFLLNVETTTGIDDILDNQISIYPNPTKGNMDLTLPVDVSGEVRIKVVNMVGETVKEFSYEASGLIKLDISELANSLYFISIEIGDYSKSVKVIKE